MVDTLKRLQSLQTDAMLKNIAFDIFTPTPDMKGKIEVRLHYFRDGVVNEQRALNTTFSPRMGEREKETRFKRINKFIEDIG